MEPSFDVTPSTLIKGVITEIGVIEADLKQGEAIDIPAFLKAHNMADRRANAATVNSGSPPDFLVMTEDLLKSYICNMAKLSPLLDVAGVPEQKLV